MSGLADDIKRIGGIASAVLSPVHTERVAVASTRPFLAYLQVLYAYSSSCQLRHCVIVNDIISTGVVWWSLDSDTNILAIYCY